ncbi:hypothetical protein ACB094_07G039700 [Castanea mollissima]
MCSGSKGKPSEAGFIMGSEFEKQDSNIISIFLELLGFDDLIGFKSSMEEGCHYINEGSLWLVVKMGFCTSFLLLLWTLLFQPPLARTRSYVYQSGVGALEWTRV